MNILMLLDEEFPPDSRVEKEIESLVAAGHYVTLVCSTFEGRPVFEKKNGWEVHRLQMKRMPWRKLKATLIMLPFYQGRWKKFLKQITQNIQYSVVHVHDLPLSKTGHYFSRLNKAKLILDQHEYYSDWIVNTAHMNTFVGKIVKAFSNWKAYEKKYLRLADLVITVASPLQKGYINEYHLDKNKIIVVPNTPALTTYSNANVDSEILEKYKEDFVLFYAGGIDVLRGIDLAIEALPKISKAVPNIKLVLCGVIIKPYDPFETAKKLGVDKYINFAGWINESILPSYIAASKVCFFTPPANRDEINNTIATKIYQYAAMGKIQIVGEARLMKQYVEDNELGYSVSSSDEFAQKIIDIAQGKIQKLNMKKENVLGWEETVKPMIEFYSGI